MKHIKNGRKIVVLLIAFALLLSGCNSAAQPEETASPSPAQVSETAEISAAVSTTAEEGYDKGDVMPDFSVATIDGGSFKLSDNTDKIVFVNLFATWCGPCMNEMPDIQELYDEYKDKVSFIIIDVGDSKESVSAFAEDGSYTFPVGYSEDGSFGDYSVQFIPQSFILNTDGTISYYSSGASDYETFSSEIEKLLKE